MGGFSEQLAALKELGAEVVVATAEPIEKAKEVSEKVSLPIAYGVTREQADTLGAWWEDRRQIIQPSDFVLNDKGSVLSATYSTGPVGRLEAEDAVRFIQFQEKLKQQAS